ncbi:FepA family TonB-dependent siderophore receptor [Oleisolibacter albus]|uniref:FepA family TonB-dependent siderophore receptor n=1 Tax=Oleisolibacter albus TaxID=2171757 RepID=UPI0023D9619D|nr:FepA family TonB-dependent siderophore receptor [Oleisolibacter albus]
MPRLLLRLNQGTAFGLALACTAFAAQAQTVATGKDPASSDPAASAPASTAKVLPTLQVTETAEQELKQAPGVSIITAEDIAKRPPVNDLAEVIRRMPGVNLTGNSASGQYGNNRQIDLRGMGPENTLILIDGKPVSSRDSIRMGRSGERNTRGDSNWVPAEEVERVEVIRGPAAARYGSGASGGVVNIITKQPTDTLAGSVTLFTSQPESSDEGDTRRIGFNLRGPIADGVSFRVYGNYNKTDGDDPDINRGAAGTAAGVNPPAGREGVENKDINGLLRWQLTPEQVLEADAGYSRQGNIYAGDRAVANGSATTGALAEDGAETNIMKRSTASLTHKGEWDWASSKLLFQYEHTDNTRMQEGLAGGGEGAISGATPAAATFVTSKLNNYNASGEINIPVSAPLNMVVTLGTDWKREELDDPYSMSQSVANGSTIPGIGSGARSGKADADDVGAFAEANIAVTADFLLTPGVRFDHHSQFGDNWSPSLNASYDLLDGLQLKGGIARAFKAPNLYQSNPNYLYYSRGNGCPYNYPSLGGGCYILGNDDLDAETSVNKEIGLAFDKDGWNASATYFHNDYKNKIVSGMVPVGTTTGGTSVGRVFRWENAPKAVVSGLEGNVLVPVLETLSFNTNITYMTESKNKETGEPLSIIPKYTLNSTLDWQTTQDLNLVFSMTLYGKQEPRKLTSNGSAATGAALDERGAYALFGINASYEISQSLRLNAGISNLLDRRLYRQDTGTAAGAATYNEPGRAYSLGLTASF